MSLFPIILMDRNLAQAAIIKQDRQTKSEIKFQSTIQVSEVQRKADQLAKEHREIDTRVQPSQLANRARRLVRVISSW